MSLLINLIIAFLAGLVVLWALATVFIHPVVVLLAILVGLVVFSANPAGRM